MSVSEPERPNELPEFLKYVAYVSVLFSISNNNVKEVMKCSFFKFAGDTKKGENSKYS